MTGLDRPENGVSVVMASYRDPQGVFAALDSLDAQTLPKARYEVILVVNGDHAEDLTPYETYRSLHSDLNLRILGTNLSGACHALNLGIQAASRNWLTFVDDDDLVSPRYLEGLLTVAGPRVIPLTLIADINPGGTINHHNQINDQIRPFQGTRVAPEDCRRGLGFNSSKLVPTDWARRVRYPVHLHSGQDIAFWGSIYALYSFDFVVVPASYDAVYLRHLSADSQSRRDITYEFSVAERLDVIAVLAERLACAPTHKRGVIRSLMSAQALFVNRYLVHNRAEIERIQALIRGLRLFAFPWSVLNRSLAKWLVVSVCFPPFADASAVTVAKRIRQRGEVVDVLCNNMSQVRRRDGSLLEIAEHLTGTVIQLGAPASFAAWPAILSFCEQGFSRLASELPDWPYSDLYSRAMWPASHVLAALIKSRRPSVRWVAEFSDPLSKTVTGSEREGLLIEDDLTDELYRAAAMKLGYDLPRVRTIFEFVEQITFGLADELVFTNDLQLEYMFSYCSPPLAAVARHKVTIAPHPIPDPELYGLRDVPGPPLDDRVHLAYFGSFYANRSLDDVFGALLRLSDRVRRRLHLVLYTNDKAVDGMARDRRLESTVELRSELDYLDFLNLLTKYHCLIVNDTATLGSHEWNPYLPSKWSDYQGSGSPIWSIVEPGSTLSRLPSDFKSVLGDVEGAMDVLRILATRPHTSAQRVPRQISAGGGLRH